MTQLISFGRLGVMATFAMALASACGGQSFTNGGDAGSSSTAGSGQGGSTSLAGTGSAGKAQAGSATGGSGSVGTGGASAGTGSTSSVGGAAPDEACAAAPDSGLCNAYFPAWYHDPSTGICRPFAYGGCGGNRNRYGSLADCQKACPGGTPNYDACKLPSDCVVTGAGCCGMCDVPGITAHDLIAYNKLFANLLQCGFALDVAGGGTGSAGTAPPPGACLPCPSPPPGQGTLKYFVPNCVAGQCVVEDLRVSSVTACTNSNECKVRRGTGCCESCGTSGDLFAARNDGSFEKLVCGGADVVCPGCLPSPSSAVPYCLDGRCTVAIAADSQR
jgi:hypothetical protein